MKRKEAKRILENRPSEEFIKEQDVKEIRYHKSLRIWMCLIVSHPKAYWSSSFEFGQWTTHRGVGFSDLLSVQELEKIANKPKKEKASACSDEPLKKTECIKSFLSWEEYFDSLESIYSVGSGRRTGKGLPKRKIKYFSEEANEYLEDKEGIKITGTKIDFTLDKEYIDRLFPKKEKVKMMTFGDDIDDVRKKEPTHKHECFDKFEDNESGHPIMIQDLQSYDGIYTTSCGDRVSDQMLDAFYTKIKE